MKNTSLLPALAALLLPLSTFADTEVVDEVMDLLRKFGA